MPDSPDAEYVGSPIPLVINRNARGARTSKLMEWVKTRPGRFHIIDASTIEEIRRAIDELVKEKVPVVAAAGGDGTLNMVAAELLGTDTALGIIPSGTMNVFARELKIPVNHFDEAYAVLEKGNIKEADIFTANGVPFLQMCGVGFDAQVVNATKWELKKKWGPLAYLMAAAGVLLSKPPHLILRADDGSIHEGVFAVMGNGGLYGGQFRLFPEAVYDDGVIDVLLFKKLGPELVKQILRGFFRSGKRPNSKYVEYLKVSSCIIETSETTPFELDGDVKGETPVTIKLSPSRLKIITP